MTDQYQNAPGQFIQGGSQGQPISTVDGWNTAGSNQAILPTSVNISTTLSQEVEVPLPANRLDYIDVVIKGTIAATDWAGAAGSAHYAMDMIRRLRITDNNKNTPVDVSGAQIRGLLAFCQPIDAPTVCTDALLSASTGVAVTGSIPINVAFRLYGPYQLSFMSRPVLRMQVEPSAVAATSAAFKMSVAVMNSDVQTTPEARGYYYTVETRSYAAHNVFTMGSSMVQDIFICTGQSTPALTAASLARIATSNVVAAQKVLWEDDLIFAHLGYNQIFSAPATPVTGISAKALLTTGTAFTGDGVLIPHVDIAHNMYRELIVDRAAGSGSTTVFFRNQVVG